MSEQHLPTPSQSVHALLGMVLYRTKAVGIACRNPLHPLIYSKSTEASTDPFVWHKSFPIYPTKWTLFIQRILIFCQDRLDSMRQALSDSKRQNHNLTQTVHLLQDQLGEMELRCRNLEEQIEHLRGVSNSGGNKRW